MHEHYDPRRFVVQERYNIWLIKKRQTNQTVHELAATIRQAAATCNRTSIKDIHDEAMQTSFTCRIGSEAVLKAIFKMDARKLMFSKAVVMAAEIEDAGKAVN